MRSGISYIANRYGNANNKYMKNMIKNPDRSISDEQKIIQWHLKTIYNIIFTVEKGKAYLHTSYENNYDKRKPSYNTLY